jgi:serine/threonine protein kinase
MREFCLASDVEVFVRCPACGTTCPESATYCGGCGRALKTPTTKVPGLAAPTSAPAPAPSEPPHTALPTWAPKPLAGRRGHGAAPPVDDDGASAHHPGADDDGERTWQPGEVIVATYVVDRQLGQGGMGAVYLATDRISGQRVAIKVLPASLARERDIRERFVMEARALAALDHPGIVPLVTFALDGDERFLVMKYVAGESLEALLRREGVLAPARARGILRAMCAALAYAHTKGVIHRDIKPTNILIDDNDHVVIVDFGIARSLDRGRRVTETGMLMGTPQYMSPEQISGDDVDGRADLYACGLVLFEMLAGSPPFDGHRTFDILRAHVEAPVPDVVARRRHAIAESGGTQPADVPDDVRALIAGLLSKRPEGRPATGTAVIELLEGRSRLLPLPSQVAESDSSDQAPPRPDRPRTTSETPALAFTDEATESDVFPRPALASWTWLLAAVLFATAGGGLAFAISNSAGAEAEAVVDGGHLPSFEMAALLARGRLALEQGRLDDARIAVDTGRHLSDTPSAALLQLEADVRAAIAIHNAVPAPVPPEPPTAPFRHPRQSHQNPRAAPNEENAPLDAGAPQTPHPGPPEASTEAPGRPSTLTDTELDTITQTTRAAVSSCFADHALAEDENAGGELQLAVVVANTGTVRRVDIKNATLTGPAFQRCVVDAVRGWQFPPFAGGDDLLMHTYTFKARRE